jgi:hypothetical protein
MPWKGVAMIPSSDGKLVEVCEGAEVGLFDTHWWRLYWQRVNANVMPAQFRWIGKGAAQYPRGIKVEEQRQGAH